MNPMRIAGLALTAIVGIFLLTMMGRIFENVDRDEIVVIQDAFDGELHFYTTPGVKFQAFGAVSSFPKRGIYEFEDLPIQFNDGGKGVIHGSIQYDLPSDDENLRELVTRYKSGDAVRAGVIEVVTNKVVYMTGPVMSSRESYAEKRNYLIQYVQDQIDNGIYQTRQGQQEQVDPITQQKKVVTVAEIVMGQDGRPARQESSVVGEFGIRAFNFAIEQIDYDDAVDKQIAGQQQIAMDVQTSIADALKAQQQAITVEQQGKAAAAQAKWTQEMVNAKVVAEAEGQLQQARLRNQSAEEYRQEQLKRADADSTYKRRMMEADGALQAKLDAYVKVQQYYADAIKNHQGPWVPGVVMGGGQAQPGAQAIFDALGVKALRDLQLDIAPRAQRGQP